MSGFEEDPMFEVVSMPEDAPGDPVDIVFEDAPGVEATLEVEDV